MVMEKKIQKFIQETRVNCVDPSFFQRVFSFVSKGLKRGLLKEPDCLIKILQEEYNDVSWRMDRVEIQDAPSVRNVLKTRDLARCLIDEKGKYDQEKGAHAMALLKENLYPLGPNRQFDAERQEHILHCLEILDQNGKVVRQLQTIPMPHSNPIANQIIKETLQLGEHERVTVQHVRQAALSAWLCYLRQSVGSCFGTAPAIIVHDEQEEVFFEDLREILSTGQLKRTFGGREYSAPLSISWGAGDLKRLFIVSPERTSENKEPWLSPGLIIALVKGGLIGADQTEKEKAKETKKLILKVLKKYRKNERQILTSAEELIRLSLMNHLSLSEGDIKKEIEHATGMMQGQIMMDVSTVPSSKKGHEYKQLLKLEKKAQSCFKSKADNALLKAWEFTVASFAETKPTFTRWNLYSSLGLSAEEPGGIGQSLFRIIKEKLDRQNTESHELQHQYDMLLPGVRYVETKMRTARTEEEMKWVKADYNSKMYEFRSVEESCQLSQTKAKWYANLYNVFIEYYEGLFSEYFQEIYDADMHDVSTGPYDDSPAGFRLIYKHGRANTSLWTRIDGPDSFIESLSSFFISTERILEGYPEFAKRGKELTEIVSELVRHVKTREFLETAFDRMAKAHRTKPVEHPLDNLDKVDKKPWVYTSGGSLDSLVKSYYRVEKDLTKASRWVENATELFVFLAETIRELPAKVQEELAENPKKSLLIHSPTHAFLLKPGLFKNVWQRDAYTYTWVRDNLILPRENFIDRIMLDAEKMQFLVGKLSEKVPLHYRHYFSRVFSNLWGIMSCPNFRREVVKIMSREKGLHFSGSPVLSLDDLDSTIYKHLPLTDSKCLKKNVLLVLKEVKGMNVDLLREADEILSIYEKKLFGVNIISSLELREICLGVILLLFKKSTFPVDFHHNITEAMRKLGFAFQAPIIVADTNWVRDKFAFLVNPGTGKFELWRTDKNGNMGSSIHSWDIWLDGSRKDRKWGVYTNPQEYMGATQEALFSRL